jgi:pyruvate/2-oxoglutarate dehydrogenase complex dihydrolipoamide dehydrogenase (E3) component
MTITIFPEGHVMGTARFDAIVIGTGQAGPALAARLAAAGQRVAIVERSRFGGTCVNSGCIPTKTLIASAYAAHLARRAGEYGMSIGSVDVDMKRVKARMDKVSGQSREAVEKWMASTPNITVYRGHARFAGPRRVEVGDRSLEAERIFINVGGRPSARGIEGADRVPHLTSSTMMDVDFVPGHLIIVGGSYIGLEFGQMYRRFGSRITIIEMGSRLIGHEDDDVSQEVKAIVEREGTEVRLGAKCLSLAPHPDGISARVECTAGAPEIVGTHVLLAIGRTPNTDDLGLEAAGVETDERGYIVVNDRLETSTPGIWALGDCNGKGAFTHTAYNDYEIVAANLFDSDDRKITDRITAYALFIDPPLGRGGMTEAQALRDGHKILIGKRPMTRVGRAIEKGETQGFMKVVVDAESKAILGAAILGVGGDEVVHLLLDTMYAGAPYTTIQRAMHIHPTVAELVPTVLGELKTPKDGS